MKPSFSLFALVAFTVIPWCSLCADDDAVELQKLKTSYSAASERAMAPIKATYKRELERLKETYTKAGKLEAALEVKAELDSLAESTETSSKSKTSTPREETSSKRETEKLLTTGAWQYYQGGESEDQKGVAKYLVEFKKDNTASREGATDTKWELNKEGELIFMSELAPWVCRLKQKSETLWVGVGTGSNAAVMKHVRLEKVAK